MSLDIDNAKQSGMLANASSVISWFTLLESCRYTGASFGSFLSSLFNVAAETVKKDREHTDREQLPGRKLLRGHHILQDNVIAEQQYWPDFVTMGPGLGHSAVDPAHNSTWPRDYDPQRWPFARMHNVQAQVGQSMPLRLMMYGWLAVLQL